MEVGASVPRAECEAADSAGMSTHSWSRVGAEKFLVRQGPDYTSTKKKSQSASSLYELCRLEWYKAGKRVEGVGKLVELPKAEHANTAVPSLLVVNVQLPLEVSICSTSVCWRGCGRCLETVKTLSV